MRGSRSFERVEEEEEEEEESEGSGDLAVG